MQDARSSNDAVSTEEGDQSVLCLVEAFALCVALDVAQISDVAHLVVGASMRQAVWVPVRTGGEAAVCEIAISVDVEAVEVVRRQTGEFSSNLGSGKG